MISENILPSLWDLSDVKIVADRLFPLLERIKCLYILSVGEEGLFIKILVCDSLAE